MTLLARLTALGIAKETTQGTWVTPVRYIPITGPKPEDLIAPLRDESLRNNDTVLQGVYGGPAQSAVAYTVPEAYPDILGDHLRAILGPDTLTAGVSTTLSATTIAGATSITTAASIPAGSTIQIDTAGLQEFAVTGTPTGAGPYTIPIATPATGLLFGHTSGIAVVSQSTHTFAQTTGATRIASYSLTDVNALEQRSYSGCVCNELGVKVDPKGAITLDPKWDGFPSAVQSGLTPAFSTVQPFVGWQWTATLAGVASTRGLSIDLTLKRKVDVISSSDGTQGPREIFPDSLEADFKVKAIFENLTDWNYFSQNTQPTLVTTLTKPTSLGGESLAITATKCAFTKAASDRSQPYTQIDIDASAVFNATDGGAAKVVLKNYVNTAY